MQEYAHIFQIIFRGPPIIVNPMSVKLVILDLLIILPIVQM